MEQEKLLETWKYLTLDYEDDEAVYFKMKMYFDGECDINELYKFLEDKGLLYPFNGKSSSEDIQITEEDLKACIKSKVLQPLI
jgi:hypothetical protein